MKISKMDTKSLLCIFLSISMLASTMVLYPTYGFTTGQLKYPSGNNKNYNFQDDRRSKIAEESILGNSKSDHYQTISKSKSNHNLRFILYDTQSGMIGFNLTSFISDSHLSCNTEFKCIPSFSTGWKDNTSLQVSTMNHNKNTWSSINGTEAEVKSGQYYKLVIHMKLNKWATQSHIVLEGFNETSKRWYQITQCPSGIDGPLEWKEFNCIAQIPVNTSKVKPVLNAGWSSKPNKEAVTWFDSLYMSNFSGLFIADPNLKAEIVYQGLKNPTSMEFLGPNDILVTEKYTGRVIEIKNGTIIRTLLDLNVANLGERGMLGVAISPEYKTNEEHKNKQKGENHNIVENSSKKDKYVFLYFTQAKTNDGDDKNGSEPIGNRLYRYEFVNNTLINPKLLLALPPGYYHNGGHILIGPDKDLYIGIGDLDDGKIYSKKNWRAYKAAHLINRALNYEGKDANDPDGRGGILRIDQNGNVSDNHGILGDKEPLNKYYAYGIRNSFGMDFDPITGKLWDTENGPSWGDEINLVEPGFNSGWRKVQGIWNVLDGKNAGDEDKGRYSPENPGNLVDFDGKGKYSPPEFTWNRTVGPTAIKFITTDKLGKKYENDMLVADVNHGRIFHFDLNKNRTALQLQGPLIDRVADKDRELGSVVFAQQVGSRITDLDIGPDGYLYVLVHNRGLIYRIVPSHLN